MEESEKMDISISGDFDSSLLNWSEQVVQMSAIAAGAGRKPAATGEKASGNGIEASRVPAASSSRNAADDNMEAAYARLPSFHLDGGGQQQQTVAPQQQSVQQTTNKANYIEMQPSIAPIETPAPAAVQGLPTTQTAPPPTNPWANPQFTLPPHLFPHLGHPTDPMTQAALVAQQQQLQHGQVSLPQHLAIHPFAMPVLAQAGTAIQQNNLAAASAAYMEAMHAPTTTTAASKSSSQGVQSQEAQQQQTAQHHQAQQEQISQKQVSQPQATSHQLQHPYPPGVVPVMFNPFMSVTHTVADRNGFMSMMQQQMGTATAAPAASQAATTQMPAPSKNTVTQQQQPKQSRTSTKKKTAASSSSSSQATTTSEQQPQQPPPPFFLFDAPCELRTNFIQSQRMHGLPITQDNNSYHYGMAVNGFHPQVNAQDNPIIPLSSNSAAIGEVPVRLVDGRHHKKRCGARERNEREQKRAQKITELIEKLRLSIEKGGWRVEMKSKYHTLTTCADYVKHLIKTTQEKEAAVEQAKLDLTVKECKLKEEQAFQESRSDPESVISSLTASTKAPDDASGKDASFSGSDDDKKNSSADNSDGDSKPAAKKIRFAQVGQSEDSSSGEGGSGGHQGKSISLDKMSSNVSEMTDSNRGSLDGRDRKRGDQAGENPSSGSISSTAAVARGELGLDCPHGHADVVIKKKSHRKRKRRELTSLEPNFELDYEEVFFSSNVPQVIATPTGKIVVWNDFFLKATGLSKEEAEAMTIFSIVQPDKLSNLFEMVGQALRRDSEGASSSQNEASSTGATMSTAQTDSEDRSKAPPVKPTERYQVLTLPCITFPASRKRSTVATSHHPYPLYMTVTLMPDEHPGKRCFHCMLTDCPGTNGTLGAITPELLALLFKEPEASGLTSS